MFNREKKRCPKHEWKHNGSYTEYVRGKGECYTEHYKCKHCLKTKRKIFPR